MNRDLSSYDSLGHNQHMGEQPRKSMTRKSKKVHTFKKFEREFDDFDKDRHSYSRANSKHLIRTQLENSQFV